MATTYRKEEQRSVLSGGSRIGIQTPAFGIHGWQTTSLGIHLDFKIIAIVLLTVFWKRAK
jgi:hypothetical protein